VGIRSFFGKAAFRELLKLSPQIFEAAQQAAAKLRTGRQQGAGEGLDARLARLEALQDEQAGVAAALADQLSLASGALEEMRRRVKAAMIIASVSTVLSAVVLLIVLFR